MNQFETIENPDLRKLVETYLLRDGTKVDLNKLHITQKWDYVISLAAFYMKSNGVEERQAVFREIIGSDFFPIKEFLNHQGSGYNMLNRAISTGDPKTAALLIKAAKGDLESLFRPDADRQNALYWAIRLNYKENIELLLDVVKNDLAFLSFCDSDGDNALSWAICFSRKEIINQLIDLGKGDLEFLFHADKMGDTALHLAIKNRDTETAALLIEAGKDRPDLLSKVDGDGNTALALMKDNPSFDTIRPGLKVLTKVQGAMSIEPPEEVGEIERQQGQGRAAS